MMDGVLVHGALLPPTGMTCISAMVSAYFMIHCEWTKRDGAKSTGKYMCILAELYWSHIQT